MGFDSEDSVRVFIKGDEVTVQYSDGSVVQLHKRVLYRSSLLSQEGSQAAQEVKQAVNVPADVLDAWLHGLKVLAVDSQIPYAKSSSQQFRELPSHTLLLHCLQAADYLDDHESLSGLSRLLYQQLFSPLTLHGQIRIHEKLAQELCELPRHLQKIVLGRAQAPLLLRLHLLPQGLRDAALQAAFPSIASEHSITAPCLRKSNDFTATFWETMGNVSGLKHVTCTASDWETLDFISTCRVSEGLVVNVGHLTGLITLHVSNFQSFPQETAALLAVSLRSLKSLELLNLSENHMSFDAAAALAPELTSLSSLHTLDVSGNQQMFALHDTSFAEAIAEMPSLKSLDVEQCADGPPALMLATLIGRCSGLTALYFQGNSGSVALLHSLRTTKHLQHLQISYEDLPRDYPPLFQKLTSLTMLNLRGDGFLTSISGGGVMDPQALAGSLANLTLLEELHIAQINLNDVHVECIAQSITNLKSLQKLELGGNCMEMQGLKALGDLVSCLPQLKWLDISCNFAHDCVDEPLPALTAFFPSLQSSNLQMLRLNGAVVSTAEIEAMGNNVEALTSLQILDLGQNEMDTAGGKALASFLSRLSLLSHLELTGCRLSKQAMVSLAEPLGTLTALEILELGQSSLDGNVMDVLVPQLARLVNLQHLDLHGTEIGSRGAVALSKCLGSMVSLRKLNLQDTALGDDGIAALSPAIGKLTALEGLFLPNNNIRCVGACSLASHISKLVSLQTLNVSDNAIGKDGLTCLGQCATNLTSLHTLQVNRNSASQVEELRMCSQDYCPYQILKVYGL